MQSMSCMAVEKKMKVRTVGTSNTVFLDHINNVHTIIGYATVGHREA